VLIYTVQSPDKHGPGLKFPPPLLPLTLIGSGYLADIYRPLPIREESGLWLTGLVVVIAAVCLVLIAVLQFLRAKTHLEPWQPTTFIIQSGIFRFSRNPIYLAFCIATPGCGLLLNSWWVLAAVLPLIYLLQQLVIRHEEIYLEQKFGETYLAYKRRVRRWL
jgi:protein-S-isoprenylcysteine O-methyltransferase Ste14